MKKLFFGLSVLPFLFGTALAAEALNDTQMDRVTGGATCPDGFTSCSSSSGIGSVSTFSCPTCTVGVPFTPTSVNPQTVFSQLGTFLSLNGFQPQ